MDSIPPHLYHQTRRALLQQAVFTSDANLRSLFVDARLAAWKDALPSADNPDSRARAVIAFLCERYAAAGENALILLLRVLSELASPADRAHHELAALADALEAAVRAVPASPPPGAAPAAVTLRSGASVVAVTFGDLFACPGLKAIPVSRHFFETDVARRSLLHTVLARFQRAQADDWRAAYHREVALALQGQPYQSAPAAATPPPAPPPEGEGSALRCLLAAQLTERDLHALSFELGVRYAGLPGAETAERAVALVDEVARRVQLLELARTGEHLRPDLPWMRVFEDATRVFADAVPLAERLYPLGTTALVRAGDERFLLFAVTWTELQGRIPEDNCSATKLWLALEKFWYAARHIALDEDVNIPLLGSGVTGINLSPQDILALNLLALRNALTERGRITAGVVRIVLYPPAHAGIDLALVRQLWEAG